ncbi:MAG: zinc metallopeptidase [Deltaproteobacteria bacterium]|jgi:Zn-dependent membrane protease YugP|nr:zinc metallopeptidase [Deltaproteobacteria bacterium]
MFFDPLYLIIIAPGLILSLWASHKVKSTFREFSEMKISKGLSGSEVARMLLNRSGIRDVKVEPHEGVLSDHYDPRDRVVRLSPEVYQGRSISSVGVAAHEVGHAIQDAQNYSLMGIRQNLVGPASIGSNMSFFVIFIGFLMQASAMIWMGIALFSAVVLFQLVTFPVEWNASSRAKKQLVATGIINSNEAAGVNKVLNAAALTYLAALITSILTLLYYIIRFTDR